MHKRARLDRLHQHLSGAIQSLMACSEHQDIPAPLVQNVARLLTEAQQELFGLRPVRPTTLTLAGESTDAHAKQ